MEKHLKVVTALSELNSEYMRVMALLEDRKKAEARTKRKKGTFGMFMKQLTTPKFTSISDSDLSDRSDHSASDCPPSPLCESKHKEHTLSIEHLTNSINIPSHSHCDTSIQTESSNNCTPTESTSMARMKRELSNLKSVHDRLLIKLDNASETIDIRDGQLKDVAKERNKLRKKVAKLMKNEEELLNILHFKSASVLDPDLRQCRQCATHNTSSIPESTPSPDVSGSDKRSDLEILHEIYRKKLDSNSDRETIKFNQTYHNVAACVSPETMKDQQPADELQPRRSKSLFNVFNGNSPLKFSKMFHPAEKPNVGVAEDSKNLANRLMKAIQDKDLEIEAYKSEILRLTATNTVSTDATE